MKQILNTLIAFLLLIFFFIPSTSISCTGIYAFTDSTALFGNNEDWRDPVTYVWRGQGDGPYDRIYLGFGNGWPQGGINECGLAFDGFATPTYPPTADQDLPPLPMSFIHDIMGNCSTVEETMEYFLEHNRGLMAEYQLFFADSTGDAVIVEGDSLVRIDGSYQVCTNFYQTNHGVGWYPCWRYNRATSLLQNATEYDVDLFETILDTCHQSSTYGTIYSNIFELKQMRIHIYQNHDYTDSRIFSFYELFNQLENRERIVNLFTSSVPGTQESALPEVTQLLPSYPNPFNAETSIAFDLKQQSEISLRIYNLHGQLVETLFNGSMPQGNHKLSWRSGEHSSGIYLIKLNAGNKQYVRKCILIR